MFFMQIYPRPPVHAALHEDINSGPKSREEHEAIVVCAKHLMYVLQEIVKNKSGVRNISPQKCNYFTKLKDLLIV